jgi:DNA-binding NarL/FixJ family response regulator
MTTPSPLRILLADDHTLVRAGVRALLARVPGVEIIGEAADGRQAIDLAVKLRPDMILLDLMMPTVGGLEAMEEIRKVLPETKIVVVTMNDSEAYVLQAVRLGAVGYLLKDGSPAELQSAIQAVAAGGTYVSPAVSKHLVKGLTRTQETRSEALTPRQSQILKLVAEGLSTKQIAAQLSISPKTVEAHRSMIMTALDIRDLASLVRYAIRTGLVRPDA